MKLTRQNLFQNLTLNSKASGKICNQQNQSEEKCKETKWAIMKMAHEGYMNIVKTVANQCKRLDAPADKCKEVESQMLENYKKEIMSKASVLQ